MILNYTCHEKTFDQACYKLTCEGTQSIQRFDLDRDKTHDKILASDKKVGDDFDMRLWFT